jgi:excisionase family DNA binding protein
VRSACKFDTLRLTVSTGEAKMLEELYTIKEAGGVLKRSRSAMYLMLGRGDLAAVKIGARTLIKRSELERFPGRCPEGGCPGTGGKGSRP